MAPQSYYIGGKIRASDFNNFADDINEIVGLGAGDSGYGQDQLMVSYVSAGAKIRAANWNELLTSLKFAAQHQGTAINSPEDTSDPRFPTVGDPVGIIAQLLNDIALIRANKLNYDISKMSIDANKISSQQTYDATDSPWAGATYEFKTKFANADARRNFFNAGGEIRLSSEFIASGSDAQSESWENLLTDISTIKIGLNTTEASVGSSGIGFHDLDTTYQVVYQKINTATDYLDNQLKIEAKLNGSDTIDIKMSFIDAHVKDTGSWLDEPTMTTGTWTGTDYVVGTLLVTIDQQRADDNDASGLGVVSTSPTYSHISEL